MTITHSTLTTATNYSSLNVKTVTHYSTLKNYSIFSNDAQVTERNGRLPKLRVFHSTYVGYSNCLNVVNWKPD